MTRRPVAWVEVGSQAPSTQRVSDGSGLLRQGLERRSSCRVPAQEGFTSCPSIFWTSPPLHANGWEALEQGFEAAKNIIIGNTAPWSCKSNLGRQIGEHKSLLERLCTEQRPVSAL